MKLADLVDLEYQLALDEAEDPEIVRKRDRMIGRNLPTAPQNRMQLFLHWLAEIRARRPGPFPGERVTAAASLLRFLLVIAGLLAGASAASATLSFDGRSPVNVIHFLAVFVGLQLITVCAALFALLPLKLTAVMPEAGSLRRLVREAILALSRLLLRAQLEKGAAGIKDFLAGFQNFYRSRTFLQSIEKWFLLGFTQRFGLAFNLGAFAVCLYLIVFSDIAFAWNTTLQIEPATFHALIRALAVPWHSLVPDAVPSLSLVEMTRYFRLEGVYQFPGGGRAADPAAVGGWWRFLVLALLTYGLLPRLILFSFVQLKFRRALRRLALDTALHDALYDRLTVPILETRARTPETPAGGRLAKAIAGGATLKGARNCAVVLWGEIEITPARIDDILAQQYGGACLGVWQAGGLDAAQDEQTLAALCALDASGLCILVFVESWESPGKAIAYFIQKLRDGTGRKQPLILFLANTSENGNVVPPHRQERTIWQHALAGLHDPYLRIDAIRETV